MNVFVGCSSIDSKNEAFNENARNVGRKIAEGMHNLVFGGCDLGLMGVVYREVVKERVSNVIIGISEAYKEDLKTLTFSEANVFSTVNERKNWFIEKADTLVFLPGGIGTIDEIFSAIESKRNHEHNLPITIINVNGYFDPMLEMLENMYYEGLAPEKNRDLYKVISSSNGLIL